MPLYRIHHRPRYTLFTAYVLAETRDVVTRHGECLRCLLMLFFAADTLL